MSIQVEKSECGRYMRYVGCCAMCGDTHCTRAIGDCADADEPVREYVTAEAGLAWQLIDDLPSIPDDIDWTGEPRKRGSRLREWWERVKYRVKGAR